jgi:hypothetical protein
VKDSATVGGPNGHRSNGSEIEGRPDPRLETRVPDGGRTGVPDRGRTGCQTGCPTGSQTRWPDGVARRGARRGQMECPTRPDGCHVIGHIIFECHITHLGWQGVILLPTLVSQHFFDPMQALLCCDRRVRHVTTRHNVTSPSQSHDRQR